MDTAQMIAEYKEALKAIKHYDRLELAARVRGGRHSARRALDAHGSEQYYTQRRDELLAALQASPDGQAWLDEQRRLAHERIARRLAQYDKDRVRWMIDEYLLTRELFTLRHSEWRLYQRLGRTREAQEAQRLYEAARQAHEADMRTIAEHDLWKAVQRREAHLNRQERAAWEARQRQRHEAEAAEAEVEPPTP